MSSLLSPLSTLKVSSHQIPAHGLTPNTSIQHHPLLIYHSAFSPPASASAIEEHLLSTGVVTPQWRYSMYTRSHFHTSSHEVLCVYSGRALLCFGCEDNAARIEVVVQRGDVMIVPAGVSHRLMEDRGSTGRGAGAVAGGGGFSMVGAYPKGAGQWDMCFGEEGEEEREKVAGIRDLGWFTRDPLYGDEGPALLTA